MPAIWFLQVEEVCELFLFKVPFLNPHDAVVKRREIDVFIETLGAWSWPAFTKVPVFYSLSKRRKELFLCFTGSC